MFCQCQTWQHIYYVYIHKMYIKKWSFFQYSQQWFIFLPFRCEKGERISHRCSKPQSLNMRLLRSALHYYIRILMFFGSNNRQTCTLIFAPGSCKPWNLLNSPVGALCLCVASYSGFPRKEIQAGRRTKAKSRFAIKAAQTQMFCLWRVNWALIATTKGSTSNIRHQGLWQGFNIEKGGGEWGLWCNSGGMLTATDSPLL